MAMAGRWDETTDVIVIGSGVGLLAAAVARDAGAEVLLLEASSTIGGTTAVSGGLVWVPANRQAAAAGIDDSTADAQTYLEASALGRGDPALISAYLANAQPMVDWLDERTEFKLELVADYPDYYPDLPGAKTGGRALQSGLFDLGGLGEWRPRLRIGPMYSGPITIAELTAWGGFSRSQELPTGTIAERTAKGLVGFGAATAGHLLRACLERGVRLEVDARATDMIAGEGRPAGVVVEHRGRRSRIRARHAIVLATGGFEWNRQLVDQFLPARVTHPNSVPTNVGDGLRLAMQSGARLANMSEAWWTPSVRRPDETYDGRPLNRLSRDERCLPHSIIVNADGRRFCNEAAPYYDLCRTLFAFDPTSYRHPNQPAWIVFDQGYRDQYAVLGNRPGEPTPAWLCAAPTLRGLAERIGVNADGLAATVDRFNPAAIEGRDPDFGRGESLYDRHLGDGRHRPNPSLGPLDRPPFYALPLHLGAIGTKGGPQVDASARVLDLDGHPIPGLFACGNVMASPFGPAAGGPGSTLGLGLTFAWIAGRSVGEAWAGAGPGA